MRKAGETFRIYLADIGEDVTDCPLEQNSSSPPRDTLRRPRL